MVNFRELEAWAERQSLLDGADGSPDPAAPQKVLRFSTAAEIGRTTPDEVQYICKPWVVRASITETGGKIKVAGKTTFIMAMCRKALDGLPFMGESTMKTPVVYLTEQPSASLREALRRADLLDREDFHILRYHDTIGTPWRQVVEAAAQECKRVGAMLLVVDTLPQFAGLRGDSENSSGAALEALEPIQAVTAYGISVIVSRHDGKAARDVGDSGRGSSAWGGVADIIISIRRGEGNTSPTIRVLHSLSRFDETPDKLVIDLRDGEYIAVGTEAHVALIQAKDAILSVAPESEEEALKTIDLIDRNEGVKTTIGKEAIKELVDAGKLVFIGSGKRGDAKRYWKPEIDSVRTPVVATELNTKPEQLRSDDQPQLIQSLIGNGVPTESNISRPPANEENDQDQPGVPKQQSEMDSVATPILYTTESNNADDGEVRL